MTEAPSNSPFRTVPELLTRRDLAALRTEAELLRPNAQRRHRSGFFIVDGWQLLGPVDNAYADSGDRRPAIHERMAARFDELIHPGLVPTVSSYLYYEPGDFIGLHVDQRRCQYDVLVVLDGVAAPLCVHPELVGIAPDRLYAQALSGVREPGTPVQMGSSPLVLAGQAIPHHRLPHRSSSTLSLAAFCFGTAEGAEPEGGMSLRA